MHVIAVLYSYISYSHLKFQCSFEMYKNAGPRNSDTLSTASQVIITAIICSLIFLLLGFFLGALSYHCAAVQRDKPKLNTISTPSTPPAPVIYEEVSPDSHTERKNDIELNENVAYGPVTKINRAI